MWPGPIRDSLSKHDHTDRTGPQDASPSHVGVRRLPAHGRHLPAARRPAARRRLPDLGGRPGPRCRGRHGQRLDPGRPARRPGHGHRPDPRAARGRRTPAGGPGTGPRMGAGRRGGPPLRRRLLRRRDVLHRRHVRAVPPAGGRPAGPGVPARRHHRPAELDPGGHDRGAVPHHEGVRPAPAGGRPVAAALGQRGAPGRPVRRPGRLHHAGPGAAGHHRLPAPAGLGRALQDPTTARPSPPGRTPSATGGRPSSTRRWTPSATSGTGAPTSRPTSSRSTWSRWGRGSSRTAGSRTRPPRCGCARRAWSGSG